MQFKLSILAAMLVALGVQAESGGYIDSCSSCGIETSGAGGNEKYLKCSCGNGHGGVNPGSWIDLNSCFGNYGGNIVYQIDGGFAYSCRYAELSFASQTQMTTNCGDGEGGWVTGYTDLNSYIGNTDGYLVC